MSPFFVQFFLNISSQRSISKFSSHPSVFVSGVKLFIVSDFDSQVGMPYLRGMHLNDSKTQLGSKRDRHENIGMYVEYTKKKASFNG